VLLFRVFPYLPSAAVGQPGHAEYLHPGQGKGRLDNPDHYLCWYFSGEASGAVGENFADLLSWKDEMFLVPSIPGASRALGIYELPDDTPLLDLDDARNLLDRGLRPTQVIERNRPATQTWALRIFHETNNDGSPRWNGVRWWSYHRPHWRIFGLWNVAPRCVRVEQLTLSHPAIADAATALSKPLP
jgi:hypothetical protein